MTAAVPALIREFSCVLLFIRAPCVGAGTAERQRSDIGTPDESSPLGHQDVTFHLGRQGEDLSRKGSSLFRPGVRDLTYMNNA